MREFLVILGGDPLTLPGDIASLPFPVDAADLAAVNEASIRYLGRIRYLITHHPENLIHGRAWKTHRAALGANEDYETISHFQIGGAVDTLYPPPVVSGTSVLFASLVGISKGYQKIYICGAPMTDDRYREYRYGWEIKADELRGRVFSMSGWTKEFLEGLCLHQS